MRITKNTGKSVTSNNIGDVSRHSSSFGRSDYRQSSTVSRNGSFDAEGIPQSLAERVISSIPYQNAFQLFQKASDPVWLQRLLGIPYSVDDAQSSFIDELGLSSNYEDKQDALYADCMTKIEQLVADYQSHVNSLPITQVQQLNDAGINSAITGQGVSGSTLPPNVVSPSGTSMPSSNVGEFFLNTANFLLSSTNGFASICSQFKALRLQDKQLGIDTDLRRKNFVAEVLKYAREHGITTTDSGEPITWDNIFTRKWTDNEGQSIAFEKAFNAIIDRSDFAPVIARNIATNGFEDLGGELSTVQPDGNILVGGLMVNRSIALDQFTKAQYDLYRLRRRRQVLKDQYDSEISQYGSDSSEYNSITAKYNKDIADFNKKEAKIRYDFIERLHNSDNEDDKLLLCKILMGYNYDDIDILNAEADMAETERALGVAGQVLNILD